MAPVPEASIVDKLLFVPKVFFVLISASTRFVTAPILGGPRAKSVFKDTIYAALRTLLSSVSPEQEQWLNGPTETAYLDLAKQEKFQPDSQALGSGVKLFWLGPRDAEKIVYYLHGGGYVLSCSPGHFKWLFELQKDLAKQTGGKSVSIVVLGYTLAPHGQYPTQLREAAEGLKRLLEDGAKKPSNIIVAGDSAGGNLAMSLFSHLLHPHPEVEHKITLETPLAGAVLISPWASFSTTDESVRRNATSDYVTPACAVRWSSMFLGSALKDNYNQPALTSAKWFAGLDNIVKDILIWGGGGEIILDGIELLRKTLQALHPRTEYVLEPGAAHEEMITDAVLGYKDKAEGTVVIEDWINKRI